MYFQIKKLICKGVKRVLVGYKKTTGMLINDIATSLNLPKATVARVIKEYQEALKRAILKGEDVNIDSLFSIKVAEGADGRMVLRGGVSHALKEEARIVFAEMQTGKE